MFNNLSKDDLLEIEGGAEVVYKIAYYLGYGTYVYLNNPGNGYYSEEFKKYWANYGKSLVK